MAAAETKMSAVKVKPSNQDGPSKANLVVKKKTESLTKQTVSTVTKSEVPITSNSLNICPYFEMKLLLIGFS